MYASPYQRRSVTSFRVFVAISLAQGVGAIVMTVVYPYTFDLLDNSGDGNDTVSVADASSSPFSSIVVFFFFQTAAYLLLGVGRFFWTYRIQQPQKLDDFSSEPEKVVAPKIDCGKLWRSDVVWYTCVCSFFGVGLGGAFGSLLGVAAEDYVLTEHNIAILSDNLALTFLSGQVRSSRHVAVRSCRTNAEIASCLVMVVGARAFTCDFHVPFCGYPVKGPIALLEAGIRQTRCKF